MFSRFSEAHTAYCYDDRAHDNSSVNFATGYSGFKAEKVSWVFGPTQETILSHRPSEPLDMVLIDGPHGYPFPELEYFFIWHLLKPGAILVLDDIHIPNIRAMYDFLCEDDMFYPLHVVATTAFFQRTDAPAFDRTGDNWWRQRFNLQNFPAWQIEGHRPALEVPFSLSFAGRRTRRCDWLRRGFIQLDDCLATDGAVSMMDLPLTKPLDGPTQVEIDVEAVGAEHRPHAAVQIAIDGKVFPNEPLGEGGRRKKLSYTVGRGEEAVLRLKFHSYGLVDADAIPGLSTMAFDKRLPGVFVHGISVRPEGGPARGWEEIARRDGSIMSFRYENQGIRFFVDQPTDSIQSFHASGQFYEHEELSLMRRHTKAGAQILDVGANIGNHLVYFEKVMGAARVLPIEPVPRAIELLRLNAALNSLRRADFGSLGIAFSNAGGFGEIKPDTPYNLGGTMIEPGGARNILLQRGDNALRGQSFDLIKIDVEGHEIEVFEGLIGVITSCRPTIFIEVLDKNRARMEAIIEAVGYEIADEFRRYPTMSNLLLKPR